MAHTLCLLPAAPARKPLSERWAEIVAAAKPVARFQPAGDNRKPWVVLRFGAPVLDTKGRPVRFVSRAAIAARYGV